MMFWVGVGIAYAVILMLGFHLGAWLGQKRPDGGGGPLYLPDSWQPDPSGLPVDYRNG